MFSFLMLEGLAKAELAMAMIERIMMSFIVSVTMLKLIFVVQINVVVSLFFCDRRYETLAAFIIIN